MAAEGAAPLEEWFGGAASPGASPRRSCPGRWPSSWPGRAPTRRAFLEELWTGIAVAAANLCIATDPSVLVVGGGYVRGESGLLEHLRAVVRRAVPYPPEITPARFGADASLRGAVATAFAVTGEDGGRATGSTAGVQHQ